MTAQRKFGEQYDPAGVGSGSALIRPRMRKGAREGEREREKDRCRSLSRLEGDSERLRERRL